MGLILAATLSQEQLYAWGWRVPFLLGIFIAPVAFYIRRQLPETLDERQKHRSTGAVLGELLRHHSGPVVLGIMIICGGTISTYVFNYMTTYAITTLHLAATIATTLTLTGSAAQIAGFAVGVWVDRFGRKAMLVATRAVFLLMVYPAYTILTSPEAGPGGIVATNLAINFVFATGIGAIYAFLAEAFPASVRSSGLAILYAIGVAVFGGTTQFVVAWLIDWTGNAMVPAWYQLAANVVSIVGVVLLVPYDESRRQNLPVIAAQVAN
jgi:MFS family permease